MRLFGPTVTDKHERLAAEARGNEVTAERVAAVEDIPSNDEQIEYVGKGSRVDIDEIGTTDVSVFDTSRDIRQATRGYVDTVVADDGVYIQIPQILRTEQYTFSYDEITGATVQERSLHHYLVLQTPENLYYIELYEPSKEEAERMAKYIRHMAEER